MCIFGMVSEALRCRYGGKVRHYGRILSIPGSNQTCLPSTHYCLQLHFDYFADDGRYNGVLRLCDGEMTGFKEKFCMVEGCTTQYDFEGGKARVCCCSTDYCDHSAASNLSNLPILLILPLLLSQFLA
ncbi:unnamed protein product [Anisakis simplex]|uniref:Activin_recp domain-containing protein n=1 Tax=Anisakis simplex TaxID=6269 RepID=A0A0M3J860_ANISI|nr:unnamed protein product [Anisakis simplex]